jgi:hypothetical protein
MLRIRRGFHDDMAEFTSKPQTSLDEQLGKSLAFRPGRRWSNCRKIVKTTNPRCNIYLTCLSEEDLPSGFVHILAHSMTPMVDSDVMTGVVRSFPNFPAALAEIVDAGCLAAFTSARRVMTDRQRVLQLQNMSRPGVKIALDHQRPCAHWQASFRKVG